MKKCSQCGSTNLTEIAPNNGRAQWLCSDCGKVIKSERATLPMPEIHKPTIPATDPVNPEIAARQMCDMLYKIWILVGVLLCSALVIAGMVQAAEPSSFLTFVIYAAAGCLSLLYCITVAAFMRYLATRK